MSARRCVVISTKKVLALDFRRYLQQRNGVDEHRPVSILAIMKMMTHLKLNENNYPVPVNAGRVMYRMDESYTSPIYKTNYFKVAHVLCTMDDTIIIAPVGGCYRLYTNSV